MNRARIFERNGAPMGWPRLKPPTTGCLGAQVLAYRGKYFSRREGGEASRGKLFKRSRMLNPAAQSPPTTVSERVETYPSGNKKKKSEEKRNPSHGEKALWSESNERSKIPWTTR